MQFIRKIKEDFGSCLVERRKDKGLYDADLDEKIRD